MQKQTEIQKLLNEKSKIKLLNEKGKIKHHQQIKEKIETKINKYSLGRILPN